MSKALNVLKVLICIVVVALFTLLAMHNYKVEGLLYNTDNYVLVSIEEYDIPRFNPSIAFYNAKMTFKSNDGRVIIVRTANSDKYTAGKEYVITRQLLSVGQYVNIKEA